MKSIVPPARPVRLAATPDSVFAMFHAPAEAASPATAVLLCPPWGWDEVASYRSRRTWAEHLAGNGHPTLRIDFPGSGDSGGDPGDPGRVTAWTAAVVSAATWLADATGGRRVAALGLGLGGLVAAHALSAGAPIDELILWAAPAQGRSFLREQRAFGALQSSRYGPGADDGAVLPEGWLEIGGFVQSAETIAALEQLDLRELKPGRLKRALLLGRDALPVDAALLAHLERAGVDVSSAAGRGWEAMCFHPERYQPPLDVFAQVDDWLAEAPTPISAPVPSDIPGRGAPASDARLDVDGVAIRETAIGYDDPEGQFFGIVAEPMEPTELAGPDVCIVFLNAGAVRRTGPNRMWVEAARRWAARGLPTVRVDVEGIGDAPGDAAMYFDVSSFYTAAREAAVSAVIDALEARGLGRRFVLIGLCAGAYSAFNSAATDERVMAAMAVNPRLLVWDPAILVRRNAYLVNKVLEVGTWQRILSGETTPARMLAIGRAAAAEAPRAALRYASRLRGQRQREAWLDELEGMFDRLRETRIRFVLAFSGDEPLEAELQADGLLDRLDAWPNVALERLPGDDHTLRPIAAQRAFHRMVDRELELVTGIVEGSPAAH